MRIIFRLLLRYRRGSITSFSIVYIFRFFYFELLLWWRFLFNNFHFSFAVLFPLSPPPFALVVYILSGFSFLFSFLQPIPVFTIKGSTLMLRHANRHMNGAFLCIGMIWLNPNIWTIFIYHIFLSSVFFPMHFKNKMKKKLFFFVVAQKFVCISNSFEWRAAYRLKTYYACCQL